MLLITRILMARLLIAEFDNAPLSIILSKHQPNTVSPCFIGQFVYVIFSIRCGLCTLVSMRASGEMESIEQTRLLGPLTLSIQIYSVLV